LDRCALFVDAGYALADGALAVHGTRNRDSVSWDYQGLLKLLGVLSTERTGVPLLRCYWYDSVLNGDRTSEHDTVADLPGTKLRVSKVRPSRKEGVEAEIRRDLTALARNRAVSDVVILSAEEELGTVVAEVQDLGIRAVLMHVTVDGKITVSRSLLQECDDAIEVSALQLRPFVDLIAGAEPSAGDGQTAAAGYGGPIRQAAAAGYRDPAAGYRDLAGAGSRESAVRREQDAAMFRDPAAYPDAAAPGFREPAAAAFGEVPPGFREAPGANRGQAEPAALPGGYRDSPRAPGDHASGPHQVPPQPQSYAPPGYQQPGQPRAAMPGPGRGQRDPLAAQDPAMFAGSADLAASSGATPGSDQSGYGRSDYGQNGFAQGGFGAPQELNGNRGRADQQAGRQSLADRGRGQDTFPPMTAPDGAIGQNGAHAAPVQGSLQRFPGHGPEGAVGQNGAQAHGLPGNGQRPGNPLTSGLPLGQDPLGQDPLGPDPLGQPPVGHRSATPRQPGLPTGREPGSRSMHAAGSSSGPQPQNGNGLPQNGLPPGGLPPTEAQRSLPAQRELPPGNGMPYPPDLGAQYASQPQPGQYAAPQGNLDYNLAPYPGSSPAPVPAPPVPAMAFSVSDAVRSAHVEGYGFGEAVARDAPALWLEAVLARKPRMPSDLEARLLQGSALPIDSLLHDEVRHALRRGFWDALERSHH
jgi:uncharacterized LabA/DUF88 family protein